MVNCTSRTAQCTVCSYPERARIEFMMANGVDGAALARQFAPLSKHAIYRHWKKHVTAEKKGSLFLVGASDVKVDLDALKRVESESLLQNLITERARLQRIADKCESVGNYQDATRASGNIVRVLELTAKYLGELRIGSTTINNNFLLSPDWISLRRIIAAALRPFPEAQRAVLAALREHELQQGADITGARSIERPVLEHKEAASS